MDDRQNKKDYEYKLLSDAYRKLKNENEQLSGELKQIKKADREKSVLLSQISHELRVPMTSIMNLTEILLMRNDLPDAVRENLQDIQHSGEYLKALMNDTQDITLMEKKQLLFHYEPEVMDNVVAYVKKNIASLAEKKQIRFEIHTEEFTRCSLMMDRVRIQQILINLLTNAVKFTPDGGHVELTLRSEKTEGNMVLVQILVRDNGIGIRPEFLPKVYVPFARDDRKEIGYQEGMGLGLPITKMLVDQMKGSIQVSSLVNKGTQITVCFLLEKKETAVIKPKPERKGNHSKRTGQILLCEDNRLNAKTIKTILETFHCKVNTAKNGQEAVQKFCESTLHTYDLVFMDLKMPVMNGVEATRYIRNLNRADAKIVPIIAMTASSDREDRKKMENAGITAYLYKPVNTEGLQRILERYLF